MRSYSFIRESKVTRVIYPHEGLWDCRLLCFLSFSFVIYPHEGLWDFIRHNVKSFYRGYLSPWGVMRDCLLIWQSAEMDVIYPHEGLWGWENVKDVNN